MTATFCKTLYGSSVEIKLISGEWNFIEIMKALNFLKVVSATETV